MDNKDSKATMRIVIEIIMCVLLIGVLIVGGILIYRGNNNFISTTDENNTVVNITNNIQQAAETQNSDSSTSNSKEKDLQVYVNTDFTVGDEYFADVYDFISLRSEASISARCMLQLEPGTKMVILSDEGNGMVHVRITSGKFPESIGYVNRSYLTKVGNAPLRSVYSDTYYYVYGTNEYLPLRAVAEIDDRYELSRLYNGDSVILLERTNDKFWKVRDVKNNVDGYVVCDYLLR